MGEDPNALHKTSAHVYPSVHEVHSERAVIVAVVSVEPLFSYC